MKLNEKQRHLIDRALNLLQDQLREEGERPDIDGSSNALAYLRPLIGPRVYETAVVLFLDAHYKLVGKLEVPGDVDNTSLPARPIIHAAIENCARFLVLAHNHPSGDPTPSKADILATKTVAEAAELFGMDVLDHFVIGRAPGFPACSIAKGREVQK
ncbi:MAG TPA: JAB domain-containing protein [Sphingomonadales bacterium]|nr:JAB domain-containing protein [Sphingomonadales bacterium]